MSKKIVYHDESYPSSWISKEWSNEITTALNDRGFDEKNATELREWLMDRLDEKETHESVVVFSQDMIPDTLLSSLNSPNDLIRKYLDYGGRVVWIGDIPFWSKGHPISTGEKSREEIWMHGTHYAMLGVQPLIAESSSPCKWVVGWNKKIKSRWYSHRPINIEIGQFVYSAHRLNLKIEPLAYAEVTLSPCDWNALVITRWKKAGKKVGNFGLSILKYGGLNVTLTEKFPEELALKPKRLACAWHVSFHEDYTHQGFYRIWDCSTSDDKPPKTLIESLSVLATLEL